MLDPDRLLPADRGLRGIARRILDETERLPIISPHGHVDAAMLVADAPFADPAALFVTPDHYVLRLLHAEGVGLERLGRGEGEGGDPREIWRLLCAHWPAFDGTVTGYWLETTLATVFGIERRPSAASADALFDRIAELLVAPEYRPRALFARFGIALLATTDDPLDELEAHRLLAGEAALPGRVAPTFRPDRYLDPALPGWRADVDRLAERTGQDPDSFAGFLEALRRRRAAFIEAGAFAADHGSLRPVTARLADAEAERLFRSARAGALDPDEAGLLQAGLLHRMAGMSVEDGLVMTLHPGVRRGHHPATTARFGPDTGHDIPIAVDVTEGLRPLLEDFGTAPGFHLVLFTLDESTWSRELAPLAAFYPSVFLGAPWWFLDAPEAMLRFRRAVTETAGFRRGSGFIDDTRAFCSIPVRHDTARRVDAGFLAELVGAGRLGEDRAVEIAREQVIEQPARVFKLGDRGH